MVAPIASGSLFTKLWQGFEQFGRLGLVDGESPRLYGGQAEGCSPVAAAFAEERPVSPVRPQTVAHSLAIGAPADGDLANATARASGGAVYAVPEDDVGPNMALLAATTGVFGETAAGVTVGALRAAALQARSARTTASSLLVTGTGLKTPSVVRRPRGLEIAADVDELLERTGGRRMTQPERAHAVDPVIASLRDEIVVARHAARSGSSTRASRRSSKLRRYKAQTRHRVPRPRPARRELAQYLKRINAGPLSERRARRAATASCSTW